MRRAAESGGCNNKEHRRGAASVGKKSSREAHSHRHARQVNGERGRRGAAAAGAAMLAAIAAAHSRSAFGRFTRRARGGRRVAIEISAKSSASHKPFRKHLRMLNRQRLPDGTAVRFHAVRIPKRDRQRARRTRCCRRRRRVAPLWSTVRSIPTTLRRRCAARSAARPFRPVSTCTLADAFPTAPEVVSANATELMASLPKGPLQHSHDRPQEHEYGPRVVATRTSASRPRARRSDSRRTLGPCRRALGRAVVHHAGVAYLTRPNEALQFVTVHLAKTLSLTRRRDTSRSTSAAAQGERGGAAPEAYADVIRNTAPSA